MGGEDTSTGSHGTSQLALYLRAHRDGHSGMYDGEVSCDVTDCGVELVTMHLLLFYFFPKEVETKTSLELQVFLSLFYIKYRDLHNSQSTGEQRGRRSKHDGCLSDEKPSCQEMSAQP